MELHTGMPADAPSATVEAETEAGAAQVWAVITDPTHPVATSPELVHAEWLDGGPALGAHFRGDNERGDRSWSTTCTVTSYDECVRFAWTVNALGDPVASWTYDLDASEVGTRVTFTCRLGDGPSLRTASRERDAAPDDVTARRLDDLERAMSATLQDVIDRAEREVPTRS